MNPTPIKVRPKNQGFAVLESILAVAVTGIMATAIVVAIQKIALLSFEAKRESALSRIIHNELMFTATTPRIVEGKTNRLVEEWNVEVETVVSPIDDLLSEEGNYVPNLFRVRVQAIWWEDTGYAKRSVETWRHVNMYGL